MVIKLNGIIRKLCMKNVAFEKKCAIGINRLKGEEVRDSLSQS